MTRTALIDFLCKLPDYYAIFMCVVFPCLWMVWEMFRPRKSRRVLFFNQSHKEEETR